jgi:hypothetical protein
MQMPIPKNGPVSLKEVWDAYFNEAEPRTSDYALTRRNYLEMGVMAQPGSNMQRLLGKATSLNKQNVTTNKNDGLKLGNTHLLLYANPPTPTYGVDAGLAGLRDPLNCYRVKMMGGYSGIRSAMNLNTVFEVKEADGSASPVTPMKYSVELESRSQSADADSSCYIVIVGYSTRSGSDPTVVCNQELARNTSGKHEVFTGTFNTAANKRYYVCSLQRNSRPDSPLSNEYSARWSSLEVERA